MIQEEHKRKTPRGEWEEVLASDYFDYRWRSLMEPLCETFQRWKAGEIDHRDVDHAIEEAYKERCLINSIFSQRYDRVVALVRMWDPDWFETWVRQHRPAI